MDMLYKYFVSHMETHFDLRWCYVPPECRVALYNYLRYGYNPGRFLTAVICNDLRMAAGCADPVNGQHLVDITKLVFNALPFYCIGNKKHMQTWQKYTDEERYNALVQSGIFPNLFEIIRNSGETK